MDIILKKRSLWALILFLVLCAGIGVRLLTIASGEYSAAASAQGRCAVILDTKRGTIYDRFMNPLTDTKTVYKTALTASGDSLSRVYESFNGSELDSVLEALKTGKPFVTALAERPEENSTVYVKSTLRYTGENLACHVIGYLDSEGKSGICAAEKAFDSLLAPYGCLKLIYSCDAVGRTLCGVPPLIYADGYSESGWVQLSLDINVQRAAEAALEKYGRESALVVTDASTGEILALASYPEFSQSNPEQSLNADGSPFLNRTLCRYNVGSVFKICVAAAALEAGVSPDTVFNCSGFVKCGENVIGCHKSDGHGSIDMYKAFADSCNSYFIQLAALVGVDAVYNMAESLGLGDKVTLFDGLTTDGALPEKEELSASAALANFSIGQGDLMCSPLLISRMVCIASSGGIKRELSILKKTCGADGKETEFSNPGRERVMSQQTADIICDMMKNTVSSGTGQRAAPEKYGAGGKTATAETGIINRSGQPVSQAWFAGFYPAEAPVYAVCVLCEDASSGSADAAPVFKSFCDTLCDNVYINSPE